MRNALNTRLNMILMHNIDDEMEVKSYGKR